MDDDQYWQYVNQFYAPFAFFPGTIRRLSKDDSFDAIFLMLNGIKRSNERSGSYNFVQGIVSKLQKLILENADETVEIPTDIIDWHY